MCKIDNTQQREIAPVVAPGVLKNYDKWGNPTGYSYGEKDYDVNGNEIFDDDD